MNYYVLFVYSIITGFILSKLMKSHILLERIRYYLEIRSMMEKEYIILEDNKGNVLTVDKIKEYMKLNKLI